jgi:glycosyltransferase involved in cell wall biosynthesis
VNDSGIRILVLMCTHQGEMFLEPQLASIAGQTSPCQALEIHDWGSGDATPAILAEFQRRHGNSLPTRITTHALAPGPARSFLAALDQTLRSSAEFDYLMFSDQDDIWLPYKLERFREAICREGQPDLVFSDVSLIDPEGRVIRDAMLGRSIDLHHPATLVLNLVPGMAMAVSRRLLDRWADLWALPDWLMHDFAVCIAAYLTGATTCHIPDSLTAYRQHSGGFTAAARGAAVLIRPFEMLRRARRYVRGVHAQCDGPVETAARRLGATHLLPTLDRRTIDRLIVESKALSPKAALPYRVAFQLFSPWR